MNDWPIPNQKSFKWNALSSLALLFVGTTSKITLNYFNSFKCYNRERLVDLIEKKVSPNRPLITVANHDSCLDDPAIISACIPYTSLLKRNCRWSLGAKEVCHTSKLQSNFFCLGQVMPIIRGDGIYQTAMNCALNELKKGAWVHIFPEGRINENKEYIRYKWGVGRLVMDCDPTPIVLPIYHIGMDDLLPNKQPYKLQFFQKITMNVGSPIKLDELVEDYKKEKKDSSEIRRIITSKIQYEMEKLKEETKQLHEKRPYKE